jgi:hypothetical protein
MARCRTGIDRYAVSEPADGPDLVSDPSSLGHLDVHIVGWLERDER